MRSPLSPFRACFASTSQNAAWGAALALVGIQVGIGLIMKGSQKDGKYSFSPSASVTISEFLKLLLSTALFWRECKSRAARLEAPYRAATSTPEPSSESKPFIEDPDEDRSRSVSIDEDPEEGLGKYFSTKLDLRTFWQYVKYEVSPDVRYGFAQLALFYVLINNLIFVSYRLADPGTIQLTKSGVTLITALVMIVTLGTKISKIQWIAIVIQICGLAVTQYRPGTGSTYPLGTYLILIFQVFLTASSGVYNQALLKNGNSSLHASNMTLYGAGAMINFVLHFIIRIVKGNEPGFFTGYGSWGAFLVILSNVLIGLAITAVYKYADAVIKCFATAVSTGILLCLSSVLFNTDLSFLILPGTIMVFIASWLYMEAAPSKESLSPEEQIYNDEVASTSIIGKLVALSKFYHKSVLVTYIGLTILICTFLTMSDVLMPDMSKQDSTLSSAILPSAKVTSPLAGTILESPFKNSLAFVRWNSDHPERMPLLEKYGPFFHDLHFSMPNYLKDANVTKGFHNLTHDSATESSLIYMDIAKTMKLLLDSPAESKEAEIDGLFYFHFDAWLDPLSYAGEDFGKLWFADIPDTHDVGGPLGGPRFECMENRDKYGWWGFVDGGFHEKAMAAARIIEQHEGKYTVNTKEWCVGWSDIYYIPKAYFADYIFLSGIFGALEVFHEVAVPTIVHIIDQSRRAHPSLSILHRFGECWGSCCASNPDVHDILFNRCGHRLNYLDEKVVKTHYDRLANETEMLGSEIGEPYFPAS